MGGLALKFFRLSDVSNKDIRELENKNRLFKFSGISKRWQKT